MSCLDQEKKRISINKVNLWRQDRKLYANDIMPLCVQFNASYIKAGTKSLI